MKKIIYCVTLSILLYSCSKKENPAEPQPEKVKISFLDSLVGTYTVTKNYSARELNTAVFTDIYKSYDSVVSGNMIKVNDSVISIGGRKLKIPVAYADSDSFVRESILVDQAYRYTNQTVYLKEKRYTTTSIYFYCDSITVPGEYYMITDTLREEWTKN
jgi:hypothetical protein